MHSLALSPKEIAAAHQRVRVDPYGDLAQLGGRHWTPQGQEALAEDLHRCLANDHVLDLVFYGSQVHADRTGFSDIDAILVIRDETADDAASLRSLRPCVIAAQRAVLRYHPMQHHGFDVVTPRLLASATEALELPAVALSETCSLRGRRLSGRLTNKIPSGSNKLKEITESLQRLVSWPSHPWQAHRAIAMFELLPTLYLQRRGQWMPKSMSFAEAGKQIGPAWWPYTRLEEVRRSWPRERYRRLDSAIYALRNPWAAMALWRHLPEVTPSEVRSLLTSDLLAGLHAVTRRFREEVS